MKLRTIEDFTTAVSSETGWRKAELSHAKTAVENSNEGERTYLIRSGVALTYAHWEGWIKAVSKLYLNYVSKQGIAYIDLSPAMLGTALKTQLLNIGTAKSATVHKKFAEFIVNDGLQEAAKLTDSVIQTESNLSSTVFEEILIRLGISIDGFSMSDNFIDVKLVNRRNKIAHGRYLDIDDEAFMELIDRTRKILDDFTEAVLDAAGKEGYKAVGARTGPQRSEDMDRSDDGVRGEAATGP